jgi:hypothetical protein
MHGDARARAPGRNPGVAFRDLKGGRIEMKPFVLLVLGLAVLAVLLALPVMAGLAPVGSGCSSAVVIARAPSGEPVECVCVGGTLSTCFIPGP